MHNYKKLDVWNKAVDFATQIYSVTKNFPKDELYGLTSQLRRASVSISSNISEGAGRNSDKEFRQFLNISFGSCSEIETQLIISYKLGYLSEDYFASLTEEVISIQKILYKLIQKFS
ncbi:MAG: four helix bundle protein [Balneola sp.]